MIYSTPKDLSSMSQGGCATVTVSYSLSCLLSNPPMPPISSAYPGGASTPKREWAFFG